MLARIAISFKKHFFIIIILILASTLRFIGTNPSYNQYHSDEGVTYSAAMSMIVNGDVDPLRYDYPALIPEINAIFFKTIFIPANWARYYLFHPKILTTQESKKVFQDEILGTRWVNAIFWGRYVTALFSIGSVFLLYLVAKRLFNQKVALIAAALLTVNFRAVTNAHIGLPDTYNAFFVLLSLYLNLGMIQKPTLKNYLLAGLGVGLSFTTKYQAFIVFPFLISHLYISLDKKLRLNVKKLLSYKIFASFLVIPFIFMLLNPYFFVHLPQALKAVSDVSAKYGMGNNSFRLYPFSYFFHIDYGAVESLFVIVGLLVALRKYLKSSLILLSFILPFFYVLVYYSIGGFYVRNFITTTPLLLAFAAIGVVWLVDSLLRNRKSMFLSNGIMLIFLAATIYLPLKNVLIHDYYYTKPWVYDDYLAKDDKVLPENSVIATHPFHKVSLTKKFTQIDFEMDRLYSFAEFREQKADFALVNMDLAGNAFYNWMNKSIPISLMYWNKPVEKMNNTFWGLSINEMMNYIRASSFKPWQAPDAAMFLCKVPTLKDDEKSKVVKEYHFDKGTDGWTVVYPDDSTQADYVIDAVVGNEDKGSLKYIPGSTEMGLKRITSPSIVVQPGKMYVIKAMVKADQEVPLNKRNGFIRLDFYADSNDILKSGERVAVSSRYQGSGWEELIAFAPAPKDVKSLRVSFQIAEQATYHLWLDDVSILQSDDIYKDDTVYQKIPFVEYRDLLYPNSHGNL